MANTIGNIIADSLSLGISYADRMLTDIAPDQFARLATPGGKTIVSNHPAFLFGHLNLYAPRIIDQLGGDASVFQPTDKETQLFSKDATCQDDPDGSMYPTMDSITTRFQQSYLAAVETLRKADDVRFYEPNPAEGRMRELFPTIGSMHAFYAGGHLMMHMGQLSAWRRMMGMGPV